MSQQSGFPNIQSGSSVLPTPIVGVNNPPDTKHGNFNGIPPDTVSSNDPVFITLSYNTINGVDMTDCFYALFIYRGSRSRYHTNPVNGLTPRSRRKGFFHPVHIDGSQWSGFKMFTGGIGNQFFYNTEWSLQQNTVNQRVATTIKFNPWEFFRGRTSDNNTQFPVFNKALTAGNIPTTWGGMRGTSVRKGARTLRMAFAIVKPDYVNKTFLISDLSQEMYVYPKSHVFSQGDSLGNPSGYYYTNWQIELGRK